MQIPKESTMRASSSTQGLGSAPNREKIKILISGLSPRAQVPQSPTEHKSHDHQLERGSQQDPQKTHSPERTPRKDTAWCFWPYIMQRTPAFPACTAPALHIKQTLMCPTQNLSLTPSLPSYLSNNDLHTRSFHKTTDIDDK